MGFALLQGPTVESVTVVRMLFVVVALPSLDAMDGAKRAFRKDYPFSPRRLQSHQERFLLETCFQAQTRQIERLVSLRGICRSDWGVCSRHRG